MSWTEPPTFVASTVLAADDLNLLSEDLRFLKGISDGTTFTGVALHRSSAQSIPDATDTDITWQVEDLDVGSWWSSGVSITVPASAVPDGYTTVALDVFAVIRFVPDGSSGRQIILQVNGSTVQTENERPGASDYVTVGIATWIVVEAADVITLQARQNSGGSLDMDSATVKIARRAPVA